jgi:hypothetical protein
MNNIQKLYNHFFPPKKWLDFPEFLLSIPPDEPLTEESIHNWYDEMLDKPQPPYNQL